MRTISSPTQTELDAEQSGWAEVYDFYLPATITTPAGSSNVIRITSAAGGLSFFKPNESPEPTATRGAAATYQEWPVKRKVVRSAAKFTNDKLQIAVSNVSQEYAQMLSDVDWESVPVIIRKVPLISGAVVGDGVTLFVGNVDSMRVTLEQVQFTCSSYLANLQVERPTENFHAQCNSRWADDYCTAIRLASANFKPKTVTAGSTTTLVKSSYAGYTAQSVTADSGTDKITLTAHTLSNGHRVRFAGTTVPGGLTKGLWYYVVNKATDDFQVSLTSGGSAVDLTSAGTAVTMDSETGLHEDLGSSSYTASVTADAGTDVITDTAHGFSNGDQVRFSAAVMPGGLTANTLYYIVNKNTNDYQLSATPGGSAINITSAGTTVVRESLYGVDLVNALASGSITASSSQTGSEPYRVRSQEAVADHWKFGNTPSSPTPSIDIYAPYLTIDFGVGLQALARFIAYNGPSNDPDYAVRRVYQVFGSLDNITYSPVGAQSYFHADADGDFVSLRFTAQTWRYWRVQVWREDGKPLLNAVFGKLTAYATSTSTTDVIDPLANGAFSASSEKAGNEALYVQTGQSGSWKLDQANTYDEFDIYDWGNNYQGYWQIPDAQAGVANAALKPYIQFDFGSAKTPRLWRIKARDSVERQDIPRLILFFSSADAATWAFEGYYEVPPIAGQTNDVLIPLASTKRYWRICVRTTWAESISYSMFNKVYAYELGKQWWKTGWITFGAATATAALRSVSRKVLASYSGQAVVSALPAAPAAGDVFTIERGCGGSFNECCERRNTENFRGFLSLPDETIIR